MTPAAMPLPLAFLSFGIAELLVIATVALLVFGGDLPDVMRTIGRSYAKFRQGLQDLSRPVREEFRSHTRDFETPTQPAAPAAPRESGAGVDSGGTSEDPAPPRYDAPRADDPWDDLDEPPPV